MYSQRSSFELSVSSGFIRKALVEMSCYGSVIIGSNILIMTLETLYNSVSSLSNILNAACCASD